MRKPHGSLGGVGAATAFAVANGAPSGSNHERNAERAGEAAANGATPSRSPATNDDCVLDEGTIAQLKETLNDSVRGRLLETFDGQLDSCVEGIAEAVRRGDASERRRLAHLLKGSSATIGATRLSATCERLERSGRAGDPEVGEEQVAELRALGHEARRELEQQLR